ncbi:DUF2922 family protein [Clostridium tertium]|uniref:DUF2922 domain-containing protein n=1 Tax=Clostridium tertium TaxID=1559 RepID=A0A6N2ZP96_9CLOT
MIQRTATLAFKDVSGKKHSINIKDVKEDVEDSKIVSLMDSIINKSLIKTEAGDLVEKQSAQVVTKETTKITI